MSEDKRAPLLDVADLRVAYGQAVAVDGLSLQMRAGERITLIGPNGAGKTSTVNAICGMIKPAGGTVRVDGEDVTGRASTQLVRRGVCQVPEGRQVFPSLTVEANLLLGAYGRISRGSLVRGMTRYLAASTRVAEMLDRVYTLMPKLRTLRSRQAGLTSGGEQQMVAVGRALMAQPRLLVIDELSLGLAPLVVDELGEFLRELNEREGVAILLIEQNARMALELCTRAYVLDSGRCRLTGESAELRASGRLASAYLGGAPE